jgi:Tfp pilus assembly protein PilZ
MRAVFGVLSLLIVVLLVGVLAKKQLGPVSAPAGVSAATGSGLSLSPQQQINQVQQQIKQTLEGTLQQARPMPDEK